MQTEPNPFGWNIGWEMEQAWELSWDRGGPGPHPCSSVAGRMCLAKPASSDTLELRNSFPEQCRQPATSVHLRESRVSSESITRVHHLHCLSLCQCIGH